MALLRFEIDPDWWQRENDILSLSTSIFTSLLQFVWLFWSWLLERSTTVASIWRFLHFFFFFYTLCLFQNDVRTCHLVVMTCLSSLFLSINSFVLFMVLQRSKVVAFESAHLDGVLLLWLSTNCSKVTVPCKVRLQHDYNLLRTWCGASGLATCLTTQYWDP